MRVPKPVVAAALAAAAATPLAIWQAGGDADASAGPGARGFATVSLSTCGEWQRAAPRERAQIVEQIGDHFGHESHVWGGARLETARAMRVFGAMCADRRFRRVRLYKIYARALAWGSLGR